MWSVLFIFTLALTLSLQDTLDGQSDCFYLVNSMTYHDRWHMIYTNRANNYENINICNNFAFVFARLTNFKTQPKKSYLFLLSILNLVSDESPRNGIPGDDSVFEDNQSFPPPPPPTEISLLEVPPKTPPSAEAFQINELDIWPSVQAATDVEQQSNGAFSSSSTSSSQSALSTKEIPSPAGEAALPPSPSSAKEAPPVPTKPKPRLWVTLHSPARHRHVKLEWLIYTKASHKCMRHQSWKTPAIRNSQFLCTSTKFRGRCKCWGGVCTTHAHVCAGEIWTGVKWPPRLWVKFS